PLAQYAGGGASTQARGVIRSVPRYGTSGAGTRTEPSAAWFCSRRAMIVRGKARPEALRVCTNSGRALGAGRKRMLARRAWKSVQVLELDTSSQPFTPGAHTSRS